MKRMLKLMLAVALVLTGGTAAADALKLNGAGASFPYPLYSKWFYEYHKMKPEVEFNYQSIGSGGGIKQITEGTVDFGASDAPMTDEEQAKLPSPILHIPTVLGGVVVAYNQPALPPGLNLTGSIVADIFLGKVKKWNDPAIAALNPKLRLPDQEIMVVHRSDGSGTTYVFTDYLAKKSEAWKTTAGKGKSISWPVGLGGKGNEGVAGLVKQTPGSIGYMEVSYAAENRIPMASIQNKAGTFIAPTMQSISAAAAGAPIPEDYRVSITDADGAGAYPISAFTYLLVYKDQRDAAKGKALTAFLTWALHQGQRMAGPLHYAPLPSPIVERLSKVIEGIRTAP